jgi:hypothetical protein
MRSKFTHFPASFEKEGVDCGKCGARCPPTGGQYKNLSPNLYCFFVDHVDYANTLKFVSEPGKSTSNKIEASVTQKNSLYLTAIHLSNKHTPCTYCVNCFHQCAPERAKNEANNVVRYFGLDVVKPPFTP